MLSASTPMLSIFNGRRRSENGAAAEVYVQLDVDFGKHIYLFRNGNDLNALGVFLAIAMYSNPDGWAWPSTATLMRDTGLRTRHALARARKHLRTTKINGRRLFDHYRLKHADGSWGESAYHVFPEAGGENQQPPLKAGDVLIRMDDQYNEDAEELPCAEVPHMDQPCVGLPHVGVPHIILNNIYEEQESDLSSPSGEQSANRQTASPKTGKKPRRQEEPEGEQPERYTKAEMKLLFDTFLKLWLNRSPEDEGSSTIARGFIPEINGGGRKGSKSSPGLLDLERERQKLGNRKIDIAALVSDLERYAEWWHAKYPAAPDGKPMNLPRNAKFLASFAAWRQDGSPSANAHSVCPICGGRHWVYIVPTGDMRDSRNVYRFGTPLEAQNNGAKSIPCPTCIGGKPLPEGKIKDVRFLA